MKNNPFFPDFLCQINFFPDFKKKVPWFFLSFPHYPEKLIFWFPWAARTLHYPFQSLFEGIYISNFLKGIILKNIHYYISILFFFWRFLNKINIEAFYPGSGQTKYLLSLLFKNDSHLDILTRDISKKIFHMEKKILLQLPLLIMLSPSILNGILI